MNLADFMNWLAVVRRYPVSALCAVVCISCGVACWYIAGNMKWLELEHKQVTQDTDLSQMSLISGHLLVLELDHFMFPAIYQHATPQEMQTTAQSALTGYLRTTASQFMKSARFIRCAAGNET